MRYHLQFLRPFWALISCGFLIIWASAFFSSFIWDVGDFFFGFLIAVASTAIVLAICAGLHAFYEKLSQKGKDFFHKYLWVVIILWLALTVGQSAFSIHNFPLAPQLIAQLIAAVVFDVFLIMIIDGLVIAGLFLFLSYQTTGAESAVHSSPAPRDYIIEYLLVSSVTNWAEKYCALFFTSQRIIVTEIGRFNFFSFGNDASVLRAALSAAPQRLLELHELTVPEDILKSSPGNFQILYSDTTLAEIHEKLGWQLLFCTPRKDYTFNLFESDLEHIERARRTLRNRLGDKVSDTDHAHQVNQRTCMQVVASICSALTGLFCIFAGLGGIFWSHLSDEDRNVGYFTVFLGLVVLLPAIMSLGIFRRRK